MTLRPRRLAHRGSVSAAGVWAPDAWVSEAVFRQRVLAAWSPGTTVYRCADGWVWTFGAPRRMNLETAPGAPLVALPQGALAATPLDDDERERLAPSDGSMVLVHAGSAEVRSLPRTTVRVSEWLDVSAFEVADVSSLAAPPAPAEVVEAPKVDLRERLKDALPATVTDVTEVARELQGALEAKSKRAARAPGRFDSFQEPMGALGWIGVGAALVVLNHREAFGRLGWVAWIAFGAAAVFGAAAALGSLARAYVERVSQRAVSARAGKRSPHAAAGASAAPRSTSAVSHGRALWTRLGDLASRLAARIALSTELGRLVGRRQAQYLARLFDALDHGDLEQALRRAIPLGGDGRESGRVNFGVPGEHDALRPSLSSSGATSSMLLSGPELYGQLRERYRAAAKQLELRGKIEQAAFVLSDLLQDHEHAVELLERHGQIRFAAELAEARNLAPGLVVRLWFRAGDRERALAVAMRTGAFADAVLRLEKAGYGKDAVTLRLLWADRLADAGELVGAIDALWPLTEARHVALKWLDTAIAHGGAVGARMLARKLLEVPQQQELTVARVRGLLDSDEPDDVEVRSAFAIALCEEATARQPIAPGLLAATGRALVRDAESTQSSRSSHALNRVLELDKDAVFRADLPALSPDRSTPLFKRVPGAVHVIFAATDRGLLAAEDAVLLPNGQMLVALGSAGVRLLSRSGKTVTHFDLPTNGLVLSESGGAALLLRHRGEVTTVTRLDLLRLKLGASWDAELSCCARTFDGVRWFVANRDRLIAVDTTATRFRALWNVPEMGGNVVSISVCSSTVEPLVAQRSSQESVRLEQWSYDLPSLTLRIRQALTGELVGPGVVAATAVAPGRTATLEQRDRDAQGGAPTLVLRTAANGSLLRERVLTGEYASLATQWDWLAIALTREAVTDVVLLDSDELLARARFSFEGTTRVRMQLSAQTLCAADDLGRVVVVDLATGALVRDLRIR